MNKNALLIAGTVVAAATMVASLKSLFAADGNGPINASASTGVKRGRSWSSSSNYESQRSSDDGFFSSMASMAMFSSIADSISNTASNVSDYCAPSNDSSYSSSFDSGSTSCDTSSWS